MTIDVTYDLASTSWGCMRLLRTLEDVPLMSFDTETAGAYSKTERKEAEKLLKLPNLSPRQRSEYSIVATNSGLSYPSLVKTTHFIFGLSNSHSVVLVTQTTKDELLVWNWIKSYKGHLVIHNALFDLKIMYHRVKAFPKNYTDTSILAKCLVNNADNFKALIGLKELMGSYYKPEWSLFDEYEPEDPLEPKFLDYAAIDGAATIHLWEDLQDHLEEQNHDSSRSETGAE